MRGAVIRTQGGGPTPPPPVQGLTASNITGNTLTLSWIAQGAATSYNVYFNGTLSQNVTAPDASITMLSAGAFYTFAVSALVNGVEGSRSSVLTVQTAVTGIAITSTSPLPSGITGGQYSYQFTASGGFPPYAWSFFGGYPVLDGLSLSSGGLLSGTILNSGTYVLQVVVNDSAGNGAQGTFSLTPQSTASAPSAPGPITVAQSTATSGVAQVTITTAAANNGQPITHYTITSSPLVSPVVTTSTVGSPVNYPGLKLGTPYTFSVTATNSIGTGPASVSASLTPVWDPTVPGNIIATAGPSANQVTVTYSAPSSSGGTPITGYTAQVVGQTGSQVVYTATPVPITVPAVGGVQCTVTVLAFNNYGIGPAGTSNPVTPTTSGSGSGSNIPAPTGFTITQQTPSSISLSWNAVTGATGYKLYRNQTYLTTVSSGTTYTDTGAANANMPTLGNGNPDPNTAAPSTAYSYTISSLDSTGAEGVQQTILGYTAYSNGTWNWPGDFSYLATANYQDQSGGPQGGVADIQINVTAPYGIWQPYTGGNVGLWDLNCSMFDHMAMDLKPTVAGQDWKLSLVSRQPSPTGDVFSLKHVNISSYGAITAGAWNTYQIPLTDITIGATAFNGTVGAPYGTYTYNSSGGTYKTATLTINSTTSGPTVDVGAFISGGSLPASTFICACPSGQLGGPYTITGPNITNSTSATNASFIGTRYDLYKVTLQDLTGNATNTYYVDNVKFYGTQTPGSGSGGGGGTQQTPYVRQWFCSANTGSAYPATVTVTVGDTSLTGGGIRGPTLAGSTLVAFPTFSYDVQNTASITDSKGQTWSVIQKIADTTPASQGHQWLQANVMQNSVALSSTDTITMGNAYTDYEGFLVLEIANVAANSYLGSNAVWQQNVAGTANNNINSGSIPAQTGNVIVVATTTQTTQSGNAPYLALAGTSYTTGGNWFANPNAGNNYIGLWEYQNFTNPSAVTPQFTAPSGSPANNYLSIGLAFAGASSGSGSSPTKTGLLSYLGGLPAKSSAKVLSGQTPDIFIGASGTVSQAMQSVTPLLAQTGQLPSILGIIIDCVGSSFSGSYPISVAQQIAANQWAANGLVQASLYLGCPTGKGPCLDGGLNPNTSGFITAAQLNQMATPGTTIYNNWQSQLAYYATQLKNLTAGGNVILFRPFIELNGHFGSDWYGGITGGTAFADFQTVWQQMYNYLNVTAGLANNLIWIYSVNQNVGNYMSYYPGNSYVDIVGLDVYADADVISNGSSGFADYILAGNAYQSLIATGKPMILPECGFNATTGNPQNAVDMTIVINSIRQYAPNIVGFVEFCDQPSGNSGYQSITSQKNASALMNDPWMVNLSTLPSGI